MSRKAIPLVVEDFVQFGKSLSENLTKWGKTPSHVEILNILARSAGFRNFQHLRASHLSSERMNIPTEAPIAADNVIVEKVMTLFDDQSRMTRWPTRRKMQDLAIWAIWARVPGRQSLTEKEVNAVMNRCHTYGDAALLRRSLVSAGMMSRNPDGSNYRRIEQTPPPEARALIRRLYDPKKAGAQVRPDPENRRRFEEKVARNA